jgi:hypothetical protein
MYFIYLISDILLFFRVLAAGRQLSYRFANHKSGCLVVFGNKPIMSKLGQSPLAISSSTQAMEAYSPNDPTFCCSIRPVFNSLLGRGFNLEGDTREPATLNETVVEPLFDIKRGFSDAGDHQSFEPQVPFMEQLPQSFEQVFLKGPSSRFLPYVGAATAVCDLVAIAGYFDGGGPDVNHYGVSCGTTIGSDLIKSQLSIPQSRL